MPRNYGRTATSIWRDKDFRQLSPEGRFVYMMLFNQANISAVGVLEVTETRWAGNTGYTAGTVRDALEELEKREYIVTDHETEEVLIRSFVKWDGGSTNDLRRKAIRDSANAVASDLLRASIAHELDRIGVPHGISIPDQSPIDTRRVVVKEVSTAATPNRNPDPHSADHEGEPIPPADAGPPPMYCSKHPDGTEQPCGPCAAARKRYATWSADRLEREVQAKADAAKARRECQWCDDAGIRLDPESGRPLGRCDHSPPDQPPPADEPEGETA
jgi:hypothetical protein